VGIRAVPPIQGRQRPIVVRRCFPGAGDHGEKG
jgi:hypothetical protein